MKLVSDESTYFYKKNREFFAVI